MLLRSPMLSEAEETTAIADYSLNSEITVIKLLNKFAAKFNKMHDIVLMVELGDLREGLLPSQVGEYVEQIIDLKHIRLVGLGVNLTCLNGIKPTFEKMEKLIAIAESIQKKHEILLEIISGGNSANYQWAKEITDAGMIPFFMAARILFVTVW